MRCKELGAGLWQVVVRENVAASVALVRVADASPSATPPGTVNVIVMEIGLAGVDARVARIGRRIDFWAAPP